MGVALEQTVFYERLMQPGNEAKNYLGNPIMQKDVWNVESDLPVLAAEASITNRANLYFSKLTLPWLKQLTKLSILVKTSTRGWRLGILRSILYTTKKFCDWLVEQGYVMPSALTLGTVQRWAQQAQSHDKKNLQILLNVLRKLGCIHFQVIWKRSEINKSGQTIPEEIKQQLDEALKSLDDPIYLIFKLHAALATRSIELSKLPSNCLRQREQVTRIRIPTGKQDDAFREQDLPEELIPLVEQQQAFVRKQFGHNFPWLFPNWHHEFQGSIPSWPPLLIYRPEQLRRSGTKLNKLLRDLIKQNSIRTHDGQLAHVTTHQFRRTYGTVAYRMGKRTDQIRNGLRHLNDDMQDAYVISTPREREKKIKTFVNKNGKQVIYKTDRDRELLRREWQLRQTELGLCLRPDIIKDCEFEHICLGCEHAHYTSAHLPQLQKLREQNQQLLTHSLESGQANSRRANSARQQIDILSTIIAHTQQAAAGANCEKPSMSSVQ